MVTIALWYIIQVYDTCYNNCGYVCEIHILCERHAYGRAMGEEGCVYFLPGAYPRPAASVYVPLFLHGDFCVSFQFNWF